MRNAGRNEKARALTLCHNGASFWARLRFAEIAGRRFINDAQATTPEAAIAALRAMDRPAWLLCGGADKGSSFAALADEIVARAAGAACYGRVGDRLRDEIRRRRSDFDCVGTDKLCDAVEWCWRRTLGLA